MNAGDKPAYSILELADEWKPKSDHFKAVVASIKHDAEHQKWYLKCPHCYGHLGLDVTVQEPRPR